MGRNWELLVGGSDLEFEGGFGGFFVSAECFGDFSRLGR